MSAMSPEVQQQGDHEALLSSGVSHDGDGADGAAKTLDQRESERAAEGDTTSGKGRAKRSRWPWRKSNKDGQENSEQAEGRGEVKKEGPFTYDWDNGERVIWRACKRSRAEVVSIVGVAALVYGSNSCGLALLVVQKPSLQAAVGVRPPYVVAAFL